MAKVSIIIPTWNTGPLTFQNLTYLLAQCPLPDYEIIVVDNASTDSTPQLFRPLKNIKYHRLEKNFGYGHACNAGAALASGQYFFFLNSDMQLVGGLNEMVNFARSDSTIGLTGPCFLNPDSSPQGSVFPPQTVSNAFREFWLGQLVFSKYTPDSEKPISVWALSGGAVLIRADLFQSLGGWDSRYHMYYEDLELCRSVRNRGLKIFYYPTCRFLHRHGASGQSLAPPQNQWRRLIKSSQIYHGYFYHYFLNFIIWSGQKFSRFRKTS